VESEDLRTGETKHTASAYLTFVALDEDGRPRNVPPLKLETEEDVRRNREARARKKIRLSLKEQERRCQEKSDNCEL
jgi:acyl-CoA hydrolase